MLDRPEDKQYDVLTEDEADDYYIVDYCAFATDEEPLVREKLPWFRDPSTKPGVWESHSRLGTEKSHQINLSLLHFMASTQLKLIRMSW